MFVGFDWFRFRSMLLVFVNIWNFFSSVTLYRLSGFVFGIGTFLNLETIYSHLEHCLSSSFVLLVSHMHYTICDMRHFSYDITSCLPHFYLLIRSQYVL